MHSGTEYHTVSAVHAVTKDNSCELIELHKAFGLSHTTAAMEFLVLTRKYYSVLLAIALYALVPVWAITGNCSHYYLSQPIGELTCNPYHDLNPVVMLECNAFGQGDKSYDIFWFRSLKVESTDNVRLLSNSRLSTNAFNKVSINTTTYKGGFIKSQLTIAKLNPADSGAYWCQIAVIAKDNSTITVLQPSQRTYLLQEENYTGLPPCAKEAEQVEAVSRCADEPPPSQPPPNEVPTTFSTSDAPLTTQITPLTTENTTPTATTATSLTPTTSETDSTDSSPPGGSEVTSNPTSVLSNDSCTEEGTAGSGLPSWLYGVIAAGATAVTANVVIVLVILIACGVSKRIQKDSSGSGVKHSEVESQLQHIRPSHVTNHQTEPMSIPSASNGRLTSGHRETLPMHLSVVRVTSSNSDYVYSEISAPQGNPQSPPLSTSNQSSSVQLHSGVSHAQPVSASSTPTETGECTIAAKDVRNNKKTVTKTKSKKPLPLPKPHILCAPKRHHSTQNSSDGTGNDTDLKSKSTYHTINTQTLDAPTVYTTLDQGHGLIREQNTSFTGNDSKNANQTYQALTPMTTDYMTLYCTTA